MSNHNKIRPVDKNNLDGKYKIYFIFLEIKDGNLLKIKLYILSV